MEENFEKKPKRPRIGEMKTTFDEAAPTSRTESTPYSGHDEHRQDENPSTNEFPTSGYQRQGYQPRGYQRGYQQGGYNRGGYQRGYQRQGYQPRYQQPASQTEEPEAEGESGTQQQSGYQQGGYQQGGYRQGGYQRQGYQPRQQGGYRQGGYNRGGQQGGYRQGGYNRGGQQGGYRQGGYNQGGYNRGGYQQGGYQQGGYRKPMQRKPQGPRPQMRFTPRPKRVEYEEPAIDPNMQVRLNKFMANAGVCSRREADELILKGLVKVNGEVVTELGVKITPKDVVEYNDNIVTSEKKCYILLNKPKDCVTTSDDPNGRKTVMDIVKGACEERIYPVGRLDRNTTGVLLLTNDGDLASKLTHPKFVKKKIYQVWTDKPISEEDMQRIADGVELDDGPIHADAVSYVSPTDRKQAGIEIHSGRNRVVRRIFESLGYHVVKLDRVYFAGLTKKNLPRGRWRYLTQEEVNFLKLNSSE